MDIRPILSALLALALSAQSVLCATRGSFNLGSLLVYLATAAAWLYTFLYRPIGQFCAHGPGRVLKYLFVAGLVLLAALVAFVCLAGYAMPAQGNERAIIVLGAGLRGEEPSGMLARRLDAALEVWQENPDAVLVVSGGQGPDEVIPEGQAMQQYLLRKGVPEEKILVEDKSTSTQENFRFSIRLLEEAGISASEPVAFSTSDFHCWRAAQYARKEGLSEVRCIPASSPPTMVVPSTLREAFAVLYYAAFQR